MNLTQKLVLSIALLFIGFTNIKAGEPVRWGVVGGLNTSTVKTGADSRLGYHLGVKVEKALPHNFYLESGLMYTRKGFDYSSLSLNEEGEYQDGTYYTSLKMEANKNLLELPIYVGYKLPVSKKVKLFVAAGGYLGYGLSGKLDGSSFTYGFGREEAPQYIIKEREYFNHKVYDTERRFDFGVGAKVGVELFDKFQISITRDWGLHNLYKNKTFMNNRNAMLSVSYMFN